MSYYKGSRAVDLPKAQVSAGSRAVDLSKAQISFDLGLRRHMVSVYNYMLVGLLVTGCVAYWVSSNLELMAVLYGTSLRWLVMLSPLAFVLVISFGIQRLSSGVARWLFFAYSGVMGLSLSFIFLAFTGASIFRVFFITAGTFAFMSLWGYTTQRDLTKYGSFLFMGLIGIVLASLVNLFMGLESLQFAISVIGVLVFTGLTAWDTQRIKESYVQEGGEYNQKGAILGALSLYLNFVNLFMMLLYLLGNRE